MTGISEFIFTIGALWLFYVYAVYPVALYLAGLARPFVPRNSEEYLPSVSVLISARNEAANIGWKVSETLDWEYPQDRLNVLVASDGSEDATDKILRQISSPRFKYLHLEEGKGKGAALNQLSCFATGELLFFSDANSHIDPTCMKTMVRHFADPRVGCVTGIEQSTKGGVSVMMTRATSSFLDYEALVNRLESHLGSVLVCDGSIFCIRRSLFATLQPDIANDLELPIRIGAKGWRVIFEPNAKSFERAAGSPAEEYNRKKRICAQGLLGFWKLRRELRGFRAWQFISRKALRWFGMVPLVGMFLSSLWMTANPFGAVLLVCQLVFYSFAVCGWWLANHNRKGHVLTTLPFYFVAVNVAAFAGMMETILGRRFSRWESPHRSRAAGSCSPASELTGN